MCCLTILSHLDDMLANFLRLACDGDVLYSQLSTFFYYNWVSSTLKDIGR